VNLEAKLVTALEELDRLRGNNKKKKNCRNMKRRIMILLKQKKTVIILKTQLEEAKMIEEVVRSQLKEKEEKREKLEDEIVS
jgi:hypothetical protein